MRIAWIGGPSSGGVGGLCLLFLRELVKHASVDLYAPEGLGNCAELEEKFDGNRNKVFSFPTGWNWNSWYGRNAKVAFVVSFIKRLKSYRKMIDALLLEHKKQPYHVVVQFSQGELFRLGKYAGEIPIILFPCVHAAGERHWCQKEIELSKQCEPGWWRQVRDVYLRYRSALQRRDYHRARGVIGMSRRFNESVQKDYGILGERQGVVYNPIEIPGNIDLNPTEASDHNKVRLLFVGRISVRKGIQNLLAIVPKLFQEDPDLDLAIIGAGSLWSNYEPLLKDLPNDRCIWLKSMPNEDVFKEMLKRDILLVPSSYEPGGIVVGEALASGMIAVVSDEVGTAENLPPSVCKAFPAGDDEAFLDAVRQAVNAIRVSRKDLKKEAKRIAREQFAPARMTALLLNEIARLTKA